MRWRLTLAYVALLAVLLAGFGVYQYLSLRGSLIAARVSSLQDDVAVARALVARSTAPAVRGARVLCATDTGIDLVGRVLATSVASVSGRTVAVIVYDADLQVAAQAPAGNDLPRLDPAGLQRALGGARSGPEVVAGAGGQDQLVVGFPVRSGLAGGKVCGVAQLSTSMAPLDAVLHDELSLLALGSAVALLVATVAGVFLTSRALRPLRRLTSTSQQLAGGDLRARSGVERREDEIGVLARSFDEMAARIEESFAAQQDSEERTRRFIADASHELRTPLTALKGYIDVVRRGATPDPAALDAALEAMGREAERMRVLVLDLLTLARVDASRGAQSQTVDLSELVGHQLDEGVPGMPERLERELGPGVLATADRNAALTIVRNLLVNACKYAPGARQTWRTWSDGGRTQLSVRDDGPGIAAMDIPHVFERFYRGEKARAREDGGSGLGLAIVQALARAQGGDASIESEEGRGTTVTVWFPAAGPPPPPATGRTVPGS